MKQGVSYKKVDGKQVREVRTRGFSGWTISGTLSTVSLVMGAAKRKGLVAANPVKDLERKERPTVGGDEVRVLEPGEILALLDNAGPTFRPLLTFLVFSGLRLGECLGLRWMDIDTDGGMMHVRNQLDQSRELAPLKTGAGRRDIEIDAGFAKLLVAHRLESLHSSDTDFVFPSPNGRGRDHRSAGRGIERAAERAGLTGVSAHTCRHTFASG
jgi:integrase